VDGVQISTTNQADSSLVLGANSPSNKVFPFCPEYHDRILTHNGQLMHMVRYIQDNPRRLALKRANKELFKIRQDVRLNNLP
jgi:5'(3')-deoxyribonucleotidase